MRQAAVKHVDETGWKQAGHKRWLWLAAKSTVAAFLIHAHRGWDAVVALPGEAVTGLVCSDRWSAYRRLSRWCRQIGWAHLKRDFQKLVDRGGPAARLGSALQPLAERVFAEWHLFRGGGCDREALQERLDGTAQELERLLRAGRRCAAAKAATFCQRAGVVAGGVAFRGDRRGGADEQPRGASAAPGRAVAEERLRLSQRGGLPFCRADVDGGTDAPPARAVGAALPV